jgi:ABC-2 type transport system ATP-binding protein
VLLEIDGISKQYRRGVLANDNITLGVDAGEVFGLLGPNGAGKTTLISQILGLAKPTAGTITIDGVDVIRAPAVARQGCSYQPQTGSPVQGLSPREAITLAGRLRGGGRATVDRRCTELIAALELGEWEDKITPLSGGVSRLVGFAMAAVVPGRIVILDEPTNDVDPMRRKLMWTQVRALADNGAAVLLVTHNVLEAERCVDRLAIVDHGRVISQGTPASMKSDLGASLRLELVLEPGAPPPAVFPLGAPVTVGRRLFMDLTLADAGAAVAWAKQLTDDKTVAEFFLGPASLEDVYVRSVRPQDGTYEEEAAAVA